jgi:type VI secretion system protein ImpC
MELPMNPTPENQPPTDDTYCQIVIKLIEVIDQKLTAQLNEIIHQPAFQKLEATWRGLQYLVNQSETGETLKIRVLNFKKSEVYTDLIKAIKFDEITLFKKIYENEYCILGGTPYALLVGDYEFDHSIEDLELLKRLSSIAAEAHAPFVANASPKLFGFDSYQELNNPRELAKIFDSVEYAPWNAFRESEDSRYVALTLPRVLSRPPYGEHNQRVEAFPFEEDLEGTDHNKYAWMGSAWPYAARVTDAFAKSGWLANLSGMQNGGKVEGLPIPVFPTDGGGLAMKCPIEVLITDRREYELSNLGFLPLMQVMNASYAVFLGTQSCQKAKVYQNSPDANSSAVLSTKLNHILCMSRFVHYLKIMARYNSKDDIEPREVELSLNNWIQKYVMIDRSSLRNQDSLEFPLSQAHIEVHKVKGKPGHYQLVAYLTLHFKSDVFSCNMRLVASIPWLYR